MDGNAITGVEKYATKKTDKPYKKKSCIKAIEKMGFGPEKKKKE